MAGNPYREIALGVPGRIGWRIHYFDQVVSTQKVAAEMARQGAEQGTVVIAETQSAGRGRMGRRWYSPTGVNLYATIILRPAIALADVAQLGLMAGVAAAEALETVAPGMIALKWPNDVWLSGRKGGGIIAEAVTDGRQRLDCVLLGIGLNVNLEARQIPHELRETATSVLLATGRRCDRVALAGALFRRLDARYVQTLSHGFGALKSRWLHYSALTGRRVTVAVNGTRVKGLVTGIDDDGALMLQTSTGLRRILAGDVSVEGAYRQSWTQR